MKTLITVNNFEVAEVGIPVFIGGGRSPLAYISKVVEYKRGKYVEFEHTPLRLTKFCGWFKNNGELIKGKLVNIK